MEIEARGDGIVNDGLVHLLGTGYGRRWRQTPGSVRLIGAHPHQTPGNFREPVWTNSLGLADIWPVPAKSANDGCKPPSDGSRVANLVIPAILRHCGTNRTGSALSRGMFLWPSWVCGATPYHTHQVIELPVMRPEVAHWLLHQGRCLSCGNRCKAPWPAEQVSGYGPRLTGFIGEMAGIVGASRSAVQALCASVFGIPLSKGAIQKMVDRVSEAIMPHYDTIGEVARCPGQLH